MKPLKAALLRSTAARSSQRTRVSMNALLFFRGLPTTYYLLPTTYYTTNYYLLPTTYYLLPTTYYQLPTTYYLLRTTNYELRTTNLLTTHYSLLTTNYCYCYCYSCSSSYSSFFPPVVRVASETPVPITGLSRSIWHAVNGLLKEALATRLHLSFFFFFFFFFFLFFSSLLPLSPAST